MSDTRDQLRRYLEQRREAGETDLVLDGLPVEDVLKLVGVRAGTARKVNESSPAAPGAPAPAVDDSTRRATRPASEAEEAGDWRRAIREAEQASAPRPATPPTSGPGSKMTFVAPPDAPPPGDAAPDGLSVGKSSAELFGGALPNLTTLEQVAEVVAKCTRCPLYATATNPVPGEGNPNADLMIVGEAPGATEDETGRPFVGQSGELLTKILGAIDLKREDVFIVNVLKHRPPSNRNPRPEEVAACSPYLVRQIELIKPKAILTLGTFAAQTLLDSKLAIGKLRGQVHSYYGVPLIVTYHPAALLRNPAWKRPTWEDVQLARRILDRADSGA
ncbi:MAG: phage polymerase-related protein [Gemmatimonadetes bacterium]|nr:phage polymerase-related protein [Gemmatimonadota bacterium]